MYWLTSDVLGCLEHKLLIISLTNSTLNIYQYMLFSSIKERKNKHLSEKVVYIPRAGLESTSPCILVRSANNYTIRDLQAGNVAV